MYAMTDKPITVKMRMGYYHTHSNAINLVEMLRNDGVSYITVHGRSRQQRYRREANWDYIAQCQAQEKVPIIGSGDVYYWQDYYTFKKKSNVSTCMIGRGALIKPWIFQEIKEQRDIDISSSERLEIFKKYVNYGLLHWGSDNVGVENTRRFLLEWMAFTHRYVPVGILERPIAMNEKPPDYIGRNDLETLLQSRNVNDWIKITELMLGKVRDGFDFVPKHKASSYAPQVGDGFIMNELGEIVKSKLSQQASVLGKRHHSMIST
ncbi:tRNA-dihydrouridine synthase [Reticulomyxa filosa]|uniref:tRNA-dihydrouridine(47) synthase [NAD(P)(+)] n=1 Tax=Reticulomyxa filosa TaxID=46433 RepID=X6PFV6_RETFI|nr:tRNA-dihydrouridine synthase [Reticulomyxa filosa]|eukprot:ETO36983.1 tRNA-dihydrouridine synthase [Reticulomyxa filosa]